MAAATVGPGTRMPVDYRPPLVFLASRDSVFITGQTLNVNGGTTHYRTDSEGRRLGVAGPFMAAAMIAIGSLTVIDMARRGYDLSGDIGRAAVPPGSPAPPPGAAIVAMFPPLQAFANFGILTGLGLWFRHRPAVHKRLMLLALGPLVVTPLIHLSGHLIGHWPGLYGPLNIAIPIVANSLLFAGAVHDKILRGRIHPISLWVPVLLIVETFGLIALVMPSAGWRRVAMWLVS